MLDDKEYAKAVHKLIKEQIDFMMEANKSIVDNGLTFHRKECGNKGGSCETYFMSMYLAAVGEGVMEAGRRLDPRNNADLN